MPSEMRIRDIRSLSAHPYHDDSDARCYSAEYAARFARTVSTILPGLS